MICDGFEHHCSPVLHTASGVALSAKGIHRFMQYSPVFLSFWVVRLAEKHQRVKIKPSHRLQIIKNHRRYLQSVHAHSRHEVISVRLYLVHCPRRHRRVIKALCLAVTLSAKTHKVVHCFIAEAVVSKMMYIRCFAAANAADMTVKLKSFIGRLPPLRAVNISFVFWISGFEPPCIRHWIAPPFLWQEI